MRARASLHGLPPGRAQLHKTRSPGASRTARRTRVHRLASDILRIVLISVESCNLYISLYLRSMKSRLIQFSPSPLSTPTAYPYSASAPPRTVVRPPDQPTARPRPHYRCHSLRHHRHPTLLVFLSVTPGLCPRQQRQKCLLMLLNLTTRLAQMATATEMLAGAYKYHRWVHTSSNGARERLG
jgi:hypothetical protein